MSLFRIIQLSRYFPAQKFGLMFIDFVYLFKQK